MQGPDDVEAVFAALGMAPAAYRTFPPRPAAGEGSTGSGPSDLPPCPKGRRRGRVRPDVGRPAGPRHPGRALP